LTEKILRSGLSTTSNRRLIEPISACILEPCRTEQSWQARGLLSVANYFIALSTTVIFGLPSVEAQLALVGVNSTAMASSDDDAY
jgi:hypothetical protein